MPRGIPKKPRYPAVEVGAVYGRLKSVHKIGLVKRSTKWKCKCSCGKIVEVYANNLRDGSSTSCGCLVEVEEAAFHRVYDQYKQNAKTRELSFELTAEQVKTLTSSPCYFTGRLPSVVCTTHSGKTYTYNGIDRLDNALGYVLENCVPCCSEVNYAKRALSESAFIKLCIEVAKQHG